MKFKYTGNAAEFLVEEALLNSSSAEIDAVMGEQEPGTLIHTGGYAAIKEKDFDGEWKDVG